MRSSSGHMYPRGTAIYVGAEGTACTYNALGIEYTQHQGSVIVLQLDIEATGIAIWVIVVLILGIRIRRIASICPLRAAVCPGHRLMEFIQMRQILVGIKQRMINIGATIVTPHGQIAEAQHQRMLLSPKMLLHMLIMIATTSNSLTGQTQPIFHRRGAHAACAARLYCYRLQ